MADIVAALAGVFAVDGALAGIRPIVMQVWAEASLGPEMATIARDVLSQLMERIEAVLPPGVPPSPDCRLIHRPRWRAEHAAACRG